MDHLNQISATETQSNGQLLPLVANPGIIGFIEKDRFYSEGGNLEMWTIVETGLPHTFDEWLEEILKRAEVDL